MNIKNVKIYTNLYLLGFLSYLPVILAIIIYSFLHFNRFGLIGIVIIIYNLINIKMININVKMKWYIIIFVITMAVSILLYMISLTKMLS
jgi:hypothetical protein